ncbi:MAG: hypothetical protein ACFCVA_18680 [Gammaproteobacteria bacterium]
MWPLYESYDIFRAGPESGELVGLTDTAGYDAEGTYSPQGNKIVFTSLRTGDLELFMMNSDGSGVDQLTDAPGYDGGAFFSLDCNWLVWRASRPQGKELRAYRARLADGLVGPGNLEIDIMNLGHREPIRLTDNGANDFAPYWHPKGQHIIFASNLHDPEGRDFDLYRLHVATGTLERITRYPGFDGFPMFSRDGKKLVFASNRHGRIKGETNIFIADWQ